MGKCSHKCAVCWKYGWLTRLPWGCHLAPRCIPHCVFCHWPIDHVVVAVVVAAVAAAAVAAVAVVVVVVGGWWVDGGWMVGGWWSWWWVVGFR